MKLVIVESPTKAKTISKFLSNDFVVKASVGHVRDLPKNKMGVDIENDFEPQYIIPKDKVKIIKELKQLKEKADDLYFATDEDREGEAIAWHLQTVLDVKDPDVKRITFHEITRDAILDALKKPRKIDENLVNAQQARRILDRLVGYELSPFLWKKVYYGLSAGRVQSVAVRLIVEREQERDAFKPQEYWDVSGLFDCDKNIIDANLIKINNKTIDKFYIKNESSANDLKKKIKKYKYHISDITEKDAKKNPPTPFTTSMLQQEAANKLGFSAKQTMRIAQQLYEGIKLGNKEQVGLITYMRTDSLNLSEKFLQDAKEYIISKYGSEYYAGSFRTFKTRSKNAQEAHEAIRPTIVTNDPESIKRYLDINQYKLYKLIWERSVATQMKEAKSKIINIDIENDKNDETIFTFRDSGTTIEFDGFLKVYHLSLQENILPKLDIGESALLKDVKLNQHFTEPPARYNDASLIKELEENGIGRPSTYATITSTILDRKYVEKDESKRYKPTDIGILVNKILCEHFKDIVDIKFTARIEDELDDIAKGKLEWKPFLRSFYEPFKKNLDIKEKELSKKDLTEEQSDVICDKCGSPMVIKYGRYGKFYACSNYPTCKNTKPIEDEKEVMTTDEVCDKCGAPMVVKNGKYGKFIACSNYPTCKNIKQYKKEVGLKCPKCKDGKILERKGIFGIFYSCSNYPDCNFILSNMPVEDENKKGEIKKCDICNEGYLMYYGKSNKIKCSNKNCERNTSRKKKK